jgi:hypothetical protein
MTIHTIGDSHSTKLFGSWPAWVVDHHLGPLLCYSFGNRENAISGYGIHDGDTVIFALGEIDCRCHVHKYVNHETTYQTIIDSLIKNYVNAIRHSIQDLKVRVCIYNVVPPTKKGTILYDPDDELRPLGDDEERKKYVLYFNSKLKEKCTDNDFTFFDIYDKYTDEEGFLKRELSDGNVHIRDGTFIREFLEHM